MVFALILAGGTGSRMGNVDKPKQFLMLGDKPIIIHSIEKYLSVDEFAHITVSTPDEWISYTEEIIEQYIGRNCNISVIPGGNTRNDSLLKAIKYIEENFGIDDDTIIVTHDAVRPLVTPEIIEKSIESAKLYGASDTVVPATDTIVESENGQFIGSIPSRSTLYHGQTPQSFNAKKLLKLYAGLTEEEKAVLTDGCMIFTKKGEPVHLVLGDKSNIKITYPSDLKLAEQLL